MPTLEIAHIREQGQDIIFVPFDRAFSLRSDAERHEVIREVQVIARNAGLSGVVVPAWDGGNGQAMFIAPVGWHSFLRQLSLRDIWRMVNRKLTW